MKLINQKKAFTLIELVISVLISSILFFIVFTFIADSIEDITFAHSKTVIVNQVFALRDKLNRSMRGGYMNAETVGTSENSVLFLKNAYSTEGLVFGVVNRETMKLQDNHVYGDNTIGYRSISETEIIQIDIDPTKVYDLVFFQDKLYDQIIVKDFNIEFYNTGTILDLNLSSIISYDESLIGQSFTGITVKPENLIDFNLDF